MSFNFSDFPVLPSGCHKSNSSRLHGSCSLAQWQKTSGGGLSGILPGSKRAASQGLTAAGAGATASAAPAASAMPTSAPAIWGPPCAVWPTPDDAPLCPAPLRPKAGSAELRWLPKAGSPAPCTAAPPAGPKGEVIEAPKPGRGCAGAPKPCSGGCCAPNAVPKPAGCLPAPCWAPAATDLRSVSWEQREISSWQASRRPTT